MKKIKLLVTFGLSVVLLTPASTVLSKENIPGSTNKKKGKLSSASAAGCAPTTTQSDLDINNIRTTILVGGDMWWDLGNAKYEVPKNSSKHSIFAGALWIGGIDAGGNVLAAAQTYRQGAGNDFWGGPLDTTNVSISFQRCIDYDKHFRITKEEVENFYNDPIPANATKAIKEWPGNGNLSNPTEGRYLAPFADVNGDGVYDYTSGDYPGFLLTGDYPEVPIPNTSATKVTCDDYIFGDQALWWVFNDVGGIKTETESPSIGLEIRAQAFAFKSNDEINNMTFYKYQIINRSFGVLSQTYFGQWADPDLGKYDDDYVGCDVVRGLGYCYNGDAEDEGADGYGLNPPAVGVDFFQGPKADIGDGLDNDRDGCVDCTFITEPGGNVITVPDNELPELIIMSKFVYYENNFSVTGNPQELEDYYGYLRGIWKDGTTPMTCGGNGFGGTIPVNFMFPDNTDPINCPNWTEDNAGNVPGDRRFLQSAGPFTLQPGAVNYITTGVVWGRATQGGPWASVELIKLADDKAQALFDNCFKLLDGPNAPDLAIRELNKQIIISLENTYSPKVELYNQPDPTISTVNGNPVPDSLKYFKFQGYQIYQVKDASVVTAELKNPDRARLLVQCDIRDGVTKLVNFYYDAGLNALVPVEEVNGKDEGIIHSIKVTKDLFATGANDLVNFKTYYYLAVSYAYNNYSPFNPFDPNQLDGQQKPYKAGRNNIKIYSAIPHPQQVEANGMVLNAQFGEGPSIKRIEGTGNGGNVLDLTPQTVAEILNNGISYNPVYARSAGPLGIKIYDPTLVSGGSYEVRFDGVADTNRWTMKESGSGISVNSDFPLGNTNEQIMRGSNYAWGFSSKINNVIEAGKVGALNNGFLQATISYSDNQQRWLSGVKDVDGQSPENWIRSGTTTGTFPDYAGLDDDQVYESLIDGTWAPYKLAAKDKYYTPKYNNIAEAQIQLSPTVNSKTGISSVDLVITSDKSKWTRSPVIEMGSVNTATIGSARQFDLRKSPSIDKEGNPGGDLSVLATGMGWFPGYAINLETGERLNIAYGENSMLGSQNGTDMIWNPTLQSYKGNNPLDSVYFGGMHYIYIFGHNGDNAFGKADVPAYDQGAFIAKMLDSASVTNNNTIRRNVWKDCMWTSIPLLASGKQLLSSDITIRLRVARTYRPYAGAPTLNNSQDLTIGNTYYVCSTPVTYNSVTYNTVGASFVASGPATKFTGAGLVTATAPQNGFNPFYQFSTNDLKPLKGDAETAKSALDLISIVPNPYYAYSAYEGTLGVVGQLDNRVRITNLPSKCTVTIFNLNGTLVRKFNRDVASDNTSGGETDDLKNPNAATFIDWDLKNHKGITVGSGIYLINVSSPTLGERTIKWFGVMRPIDLDTF